MNQIKMCETDKGLIEYSLTGKGPTILIVHGGHDSCRGDYMNQDLVKNNYSVLIPTRPGYGNTPITSGTTAKSTADLFAALLKKLQIDKVIVIGNSAGGPVALEFARLYPDIVQKLVLECAVVKPWFHKFTFEYYGSKYIFHPKRQRRFWDNLAAKYQKNPQKTMQKNMKLFTKLNPEMVLKEMSTEDIKQLVHRLITGNDSGSGFIYDVDHRATNIHEITCPTLIIHSKNDGSVPFSHAEYAHKMIKNAQLYEAPTNSHFLYTGPGSQEVLKKRLTFMNSGEPTA